MKDALAARYEGVRVLVLGASGFIGRWVARSLIEAGASVSRVAREATDLSREGAVTALIDATHPAVVFNLAGYGVDPAERDAALMTSLNARLVAELCERLAR